MLHARSSVPGRLVLPSQFFFGGWALAIEHCSSFRTEFPPRRGSRDASHSDAEG